jgi:hypothetical protein
VGALYQGIAQSKGNYTEVKDTTGFVEGLSSVDERLLNLKPAEAAKLRLVEGQGFLESIAQTVDSAIWYSDVKVNGKQFHGLAPRYNALSNANVVNGGGTGSDNASIWFVTHGDMQTSIITPENIAGGVQREDMGRQRVLDANGNPYYVKEEKFTQHLGLCVKDWRFNGRICNIDVSDVISGAVALNPLLRKMYYRLQWPPRLQDGARRAGQPRPHRDLHEPHDDGSARRRIHQWPLGRGQLRTPHADGNPGRGSADVARHPDPRDRRPAQHRNARRLTQAGKDQSHDFRQFPPAQQPAGHHRLGGLDQRDRPRPDRYPYGSSVPLTRDIGRGCEVEISVAVTASFNNLTSLQVGVQTSPDNATWTTRYLGEAVPLASLVAGYQFKVPGEFEEGTDARYVRLFYTVAGTAPTAGTINAGIVASRQTNNSYGGR